MAILIKKVYLPGFGIYQAPYDQNCACDTAIPNYSPPQPSRSILSLSSLYIALAPYVERRSYGDNWRWILSQALLAAQGRDDRANAVALSLLLARYLQRQSAFKPAIVQYRQTIHVARQIGEEYNQARVWSNLGFLYAQLGHSWRAKIACCHALSVFERLDSDHGRAHTENHLGSLYTWQCQWDLALPHFERACFPTIWAWSRYTITWA